LFVYLFISVFISIFICLFIYLFIYLLTYLPEAYSLDDSREIAHNVKLKSRQFFVGNVELV